MSDGPPSLVVRRYASPEFDVKGHPQTILEQVDEEFFVPGVSPRNREFLDSFVSPGERRANQVADALKRKPVLFPAPG
jgi:hypothetical protein